MGQYNNNVSNSNEQHLADARTVVLRPASVKPPPSQVVEAAASIYKPLTVGDLFSSDNQVPGVQSKIGSFQEKRSVSMNKVARDLDSATGIVFPSGLAEASHGKDPSAEGKGTKDFNTHIADATTERDINHNLGNA